MRDATRYRSLIETWISQADRNLEQWGLQDEETLLLAIQEELGELTQAHLEARDEDGDPGRVDEELADLGALLIQLHESRRDQSPTTGDERDDANPNRPAWLGSVRGLDVREPGPDADGPLLEVHGAEGSAAVEFDDGVFVDGLTHVAGELETTLGEIAEDDSDD